MVEVQPGRDQGSHSGADGGVEGGSGMTPEEFAEKMRVFADADDPEYSHIDADQLMCELLESLGYGDGVKIFREMTTWYA
jgi:hypothetical protein